MIVPHRQRRRGSVITLAPALIVLLCIMAAFSVDLGFIHTTRSQLQSAADSAAVAGALELRDENSAADARSSAIAYAKKNEPTHGEVLVIGDVEVGYWDFDANTFVATGSEPNAVRATVRRDGVNTSRVRLFFAAIWGGKDFSSQASSIAAFKMDEHDEAQAPVLVH